MRPSLAGLLVVPLFTMACNSIQAPTATVRSAKLGEVTPQALTLNLDVLVNNPNAFVLPLTSTSYSFSVADAKLLDGTADPKTSLPASGSSAVTLPITINWQDLLKAKSAVLSSGGNLPFSLSGKLNLGSGLALLGDRASIPLSYSGTLPLRDALADPKILLNSPAAKELATYALKGRLGF